MYKFEETIKKYQDAGIVFYYTGLSDIGKEYRHPVIKINDEYHITAQMDSQDNFLYALSIQRLNCNAYINLALNDMRSAKELGDFIENFDKYKDDIDKKFQKLELISKLEDELADILKDSRKFDLSDIKSDSDRLEEHAKLKNILDYIYSEKDAK